MKVASDLFVFFEIRVDAEFPVRDCLTLEISDSSVAWGATASHIKEPLSDAGDVEPVSTMECR